MIRLYQTQQIQEIEALTIQNGINTEYGLMQAAARVSFKTLQERWPEAKKIAVVCGKGNNAGDGFELARLAHQKGLKVTVYFLVEMNELKGAAQMAAEKAVESGLEFLPVQSFASAEVDVIIDALLGTGVKGDIQDPYLTVIQMMNDHASAVLSLDVPSGLNANTGVIHGHAVQADVTITFIGRKTGLYTYQAPSYCGEIIADDLGVPQEIIQRVDHFAELLEWSEIKQLLPRRSRDAHKGDFGHVLIIGGDYGMGGAVRMAAEAAMRVGAGLVTVATRPEHVTVVNCSRPEIMCYQVAQAKDLETLLERATVVVIGPGLGKSDWAKMLLNVVLNSNLPKVLDADSLNLLSQDPVYNEQWILTPHPGEAARLLGIPTQALQEDRFSAAQQIQARYGGVIVLKGSGTIIQSPHKKSKICCAGNPGMASGGMGDVLSGVVGGLLAQGLSLRTAAECSVLVHSLAADRAAETEGERGMLATDLMKHLRELVNPD